MSLVVGVFVSQALSKLLFLILVIRHSAKLIKKEYLVLVLLFIISKSINLSGERPLNFDLSAIFTGLSVIWAASILEKQKYRFNLDVFWLISLFFITIIIALNSNNTSSHLTLGSLSINRNSISYLLCFYPLWHLIILKNPKINLILALTTSILLVLTLSRSSQLMGMIILIAVFLQSSRKQKFYIALGASLVLAFTFPYLLENVFFRLLEKGQNSGLDSSRFIMWACLYNNFEISDIFLGYQNFATNSCTRLPGIPDPNPHNSILWAIEVYGIYALVLTILLFKNTLRNSKIGFCLYIILLMSERAFFVSPYEIFAVYTFKKNEVPRRKL